MDLLSKCGTELDSIVLNGTFSGAVLLAKNGNTLYKQAGGYACRSFLIKNETNTKFNVASAGKMFTGVAIAQLVQNGKIGLSDKISRYITDDWLDKTILENVTVEHLLTHTSGLGDYFVDAYHQSYHKVFENIEDYKEIIHKSNLAFSPGTSWAYSNTGFLVLGLLIEKVADEAYSDYIIQHIFKPANMLDSDFSLENEPVYNRATGYYRENGVLRCNYIKPVIRGTGSGGCYSTVEDMNRFFVALNRFQLLNEPLYSRMISPKPHLHSYQYGYGFFVTDSKIYHGGNGTGIESYVGYYPQKDILIAILSNFTDFKISKIISIADKFFC